MDTERWQKIADLFEAAVERPPDERRRILEAAGAQDDALRTEVAALLRAHDDDPEFLESPAARIPAEAGAAAEPDDANADPDSDPLVGRLVGHYRLTRRIGAGGMGTVYLAERQDDFRQVAALKVVRRGMDTEHVLRRFRSERQILASLDHPNIARLLDGGATDDGRPYFVMEHIDGEAIGAYCERRALPLRERIELFITACMAVHHAHRNLVVHRDLKPSNILVSRDGRLKLLDFGLAKLLDPEREGPEPTVTQPEAPALTPEYASPEQVAGEPITTATDTYSLGVVLYELLAGTRPYQLKTRTPEETARVLTHAAPSPPSAAGTRWRAQLRGDLDTIVMMAMQREPARRYASAEAFAEDLRRYLRGQPVAAQRDSLGYRARRFVGRNRTGVAIASAFVLLLAGSSVVTMLQSRRILAERREADAQRETAEQVAQLLISLFEQSDPTVSPAGDTTTVATLIRIGEERVEALAGQPALEARLLHVFAKIHEARSRFARARALLESALVLEREASGAESAQAATTLHELARLTHRTGGAAAGEPLLRESLGRLSGLHDANDAILARAKLDLAEAVADPGERERLVDEALATLRESGADLVSVASALNALASAHFAQSEFAEARPLYEEAIEILATRLPADHPHLLAVQTNLAAVQSQLGEWEAAEATARRVLEGQRRVVGPTGTGVAGILEILATSLANQGRHAEAESTFSGALAIWRGSLGPGHWRVANSLRNIGRLRAVQGRHAEAVALLEEAAAIRGRSGGGGERSVATMRAQTALSVARLGRREEAIAMARDALRVLEAGGATADRSELADAQAALGGILLESGALAEAEALFRRALEIRRDRFPERHPKLAEAMCGLGEALTEQGRRAEAAPLLRSAFPILRVWGLADPVVVERIAAEWPDLAPH